jgi:hypothetical protein
MFVPRVNGSVIPSAPSGSKLKGAYKDSKKRKMPNGGSVPITNVSPLGDFAYTASKRVGNFTGNLQGSVNVPSMSSNYVQPTLSYNKKGLSTYVTPGGFGAEVQGNRGYASYNQRQQEGNTYRDASAGYNRNKLNLNANANFKNNVLENAGIQGNYQVNPNLSLTGNYNVSQGNSKLDPNYFLGFNFSKTFKEGGSNNWTPVSPKPYVRNSPAGNAGYTDNTYVRPGTINQSMIEANKKKLASTVPPKPKTTPQSVKKPTTVTKKPYVPVQDNRVYSDNTSVYSKPFVSNEKKGQFKAEEDFRQANEPAKALVLDILPTPAASFARGVLGIDNRTGNFTEDQKKALAYAIAKAETAKRGTNEEGYTGSFGYDDYPDKRVGFNALHNIKEDDGRFSERVESIKKTWPTLTTQTTLGRASFKKHDKDNYLVHDKYNFDEQAKNPQSIMEKGEVLGRKLGIETETNIVIPNKYVEEARKKIKTEGSTPTVKPQPTATSKTETPKPSVSSKPVVGKTTKQTVAEKPRLKQTYEQAKSTPQQKVNNTQTTSSKSNNSTQLTGERLKVQNYQKMLNEKYGANLETDGAWGPKTQAAYERYAKG